MDKGILIKDIERRAHDIYSSLLQVVMEQKLVEDADFELEFKITNNKEVGGESGCKGKKDYVMINIGTIELHYIYFSDVIRKDKNEMLKMIGIVEKDEVLDGITYEGISFKEDGPILFDSKVIDEEKAVLLEIFATRFIILHEYGHVFNGHCNWLLGQREFNQFDGFPMFFDNNQIINRDTALNIRTLEMDADSFAATQSLGYLVFLYNNYKKQVKIDIERNYLFYWWSFSIRSVFLLEQDRIIQNNSYYYPEMTHFPSTARWEMVLGTVLDMVDLLEDGIFDRELIQKLLIQGALDAERKFNTIKYTNYNWLEEMKSDRDYETYSRKVHENWFELRVSLEQYARLPLYQGQSVLRN